jgi:Fic family protein
MYVRQEAVLSSQIEGTQSSLEDVLQFEVDAKGADVPKDVEEVVNYVRAMNFGIQRLEKLPLSLRLIREIHAELLKGTRGAHRTPGEFRRTQNWIGSGGASLSTATFVPPPVPEMKEALNKFEKFLHDDSLPVLIHTALAHAQFETIHPFLDGNGRVGRLLITFLLCERKVLHRPLLYLSHYLKMHRAEYYDRLMAIRNDGNWEAWLKFFLRGVGEVSQEAIETARRIFALRDEHRQAINRDLGSNASGAFSLLDDLYEQPIISVRLVEQHLKSSFVTANKLVEQFIKLGILNETTGRQRNRRYAYGPYLDLFETSPNQS